MGSGLLLAVLGGVLLATEDECDGTSPGLTLCFDYSTIYKGFVIIGVLGTGIGISITQDRNKTFKIGNYSWKISAAKQRPY